MKSCVIKLDAFGCTKLVELNGNVLRDHFCEIAYVDRFNPPSFIEEETLPNTATFPSVQRVVFEYTGHRDEVS